MCHTYDASAWFWKFYIHYHSVWLKCFLHIYFRTQTINTLLFVFKICVFVSIIRTLLCELIASVCVRCWYMPNKTEWKSRVRWYVMTIRWQASNAIRPSTNSNGNVCITYMFCDKIGYGCSLLSRLLSVLCGYNEVRVSFSYLLYGGSFYRYYFWMNIRNGFKRS